MNSFVKNVLIFAAGASIGALVAGVMTKNKYEQLIEEEVASVLEMTERRKTRAVKEDKDEENSEEKEIRQPIERKKEDKVVELKKRQYNRIASIYVPPGMDIDGDRVESREDEREERDRYEKISAEANKLSDNAPYVISIQEFSEEKDHFDKITIYYYEDDDTLTDADEEIIADIAGTVGDEALFCFDENIDAVYVRNERISTDYEVIRLPKSYSETVLGYNSTNRQAKVRRRDLDE